MFLQETYSIEDCTYYDSTSHTSTETVDIPLPSAFELSFKVRRTTTNTNASYLEIGGNSGNTALFGQVGSSGISQLRLYNSEGSSSYTNVELGNNSTGTDTHYTWIKNGSSNTVSMDSTTQTTTNSLTHSKIRKLSITNNVIKELKIKPL